MTAAEVAQELCERWEGFRARPYLCPAGVPSIGFGFTHYPNGVPVTLLDPPMTRDHAMQMLKWFIVNKYMPLTARLCPGAAHKPEALGALVDFCYNLGGGNLRASTLRKYVNLGWWKDVPAQLQRWVNAGGRRLPGLVARRLAEAAYVEAA